MDINPDAEMIGLAWGVIANVGGGDWTKQSNDWQVAAERWRDNYHQWLNEQIRSEEIDPSDD